MSPSLSLPHLPLPAPSLHPFLLRPPRVRHLRTVGGTSYAPRQTHYRTTLLSRRFASRLSRFSLPAVVISKTGVCLFGRDIVLRASP